MSVRWEQNDNVPRQLRPFVTALGKDVAVQLFLAFGGTAIYLANRPQATSQVAGLLNPEQIRSLLDAMHGENWVRVPNAKPFIARYLRGQGVPVAHIARTLHVADVSVRRWTKDDDTATLDLFG